MNLESPKVTVAKSAEYIFNALTDVKNFEKLMPESIAKFEVTGDDSFIFALKGMPEIKLKQKEQTPNSKVILGAASDKLPFTLTGNITEVDANNTEIQLQFEGSFNPMMAMMVKGPIGKFIEALAGNMNKL
ncbi:SRPBCC family protein [Myroides marinus]|uniref:SRPBCC family protein n=1 Tax=Myroides marinus TaxID=703342 RepID=UPI002575B0E6|nr:SRPBCC family protein [Myroides marinus]MDM1345780.1 SRPBCC family protein [Myroides marinus]MDM1349359.1 SRPBCC family protein [Myroides marinus]MDM1352963.1 SRPBCC family protein [Myroides marinus]MDM1356569.1 SRPBCC family protein [Myroides marinus]MDM1360929.1 SRPBCC family protein [Myroides marinus]